MPGMGGAAGADSTAASTGVVDGAAAGAGSGDGTDGALGCGLGGAGGEEGLGAGAIDLGNMPGLFVGFLGWLMDASKSAQALLRLEDDGVDEGSAESGLKGLGTAGRGGATGAAGGAAAAEACACAGAADAGSSACDTAAAPAGAAVILRAPPSALFLALPSVLFGRGMDVNVLGAGLETVRTTATSVNGAAGDGVDGAAARLNPGMGAAFSTGASPTGAPREEEREVLLGVMLLM